MILKPYFCLPLCQFINPGEDIIGLKRKINFFHHLKLYESRKINPKINRIKQGLTGEYLVEHLFKWNIGSHEAYVASFAKRL